MRKHQRQIINKPLHFLIWKRTGYAIMASLGKVINISRLKASMCSCEEQKSGRERPDMASFELISQKQDNEMSLPPNDILEQIASFLETRKISVAHVVAGNENIYLKTMAFFALSERKTL